MKRKLIAIGLICATLLTGCGPSTQTKDTNNTASASESSTAKSESIAKDNEDLTERAKESYTLNIDFSTEDTIPLPEDAKLFCYDLSLPINFDDLLDYKVNYRYLNDEEFLTLRDCIEKYPKEGNNYAPLSGLYPKDSPDYETAKENDSHGPDLYVSGDENTTVQEAIDNNNWYLNDYIPRCEFFNMTYKEAQKEMSEAGDFTYDYNYEEWILDKLIERLGSPNYINVDGYCNLSATDGVNNMVSADGEIHADSILLGWIFEDCSVTIDYDTVAKVTSEGEYYSEISMDCNNITYYSYKWTGKSETSNADWPNQVKEFVAARDEILGK